MSFVELTNFQVEFDKVSERLNELKAEKQRLLEDGAKVQQELFNTLADDATTLKEQRAKQKELEQIEKDLFLIERKIEAISKKNAGRLNDLLKVAKTGQDREIAKEQQKLDEMIVQLRKYKAEYLGYCVELHQQVVKLEEIRRDFLDAAHRIGVSEYNRCYFHLIPTINLTSNHGGDDKMLAPIEREILDAFRLGKVQPWIKLYILTDGKVLVESNQEAERQLMELMKDGDK